MGWGPTVTVVSIKRTDGRVTSRRPCRVPTRSVHVRVAAAWQHGSALARHSFAAACFTSVALVLPLQAAPTVNGAAAVVGVILAVAALVDCREQRLPNQLLGAASIVVVVGVVLARDVTLARYSLMGATSAGALMLIVRLSRRVGMGDVKMAAVVGGSVGASTASLLGGPIAIALTAFSASSFGLIANCRRLALGPSLWFGWAAALAITASLPTGWGS